MVLSLERWVGKVAIVTGASSGIGASIADALVKNGLIVAGIARRVERINHRSKQLSSEKGILYGIKADITKEEELSEAFEWISDNLGPVHVLVNSAGVSRDDSLTGGRTEDWKDLFDINVIALCAATRQAIKIMRDNDINGHIVHVNSILGHSLMDVKRVSVYPASKFAVTALAETLRQELDSLGSRIKVTSISPGLVATELTLLNPDISDEKRKYFESRPVLNGEDVADGVVYVLSTPGHVQIEELTIKPVGEPC